MIYVPARNYCSCAPNGHRARRRRGGKASWMSGLLGLTAFNHYVFLSTLSLRKKARNSMVVKAGMAQGSWNVRLGYG